MSNPTPSDLQSTRDEFALQAQAMSRGRTFNARAAIDPFIRLLRAPSQDADPNPPSLPSPLLDLACGPGIVSAALAEAGASVVGIDATEEMLERARQLVSDSGSTAVEFRQADAENLPFADASFAGAVSRLAVHHFARPQRVLTELRRVLIPGSTLVVGDIIASGDPAEARLHNAIEKLRDPSHQRHLSEAELRSAIEESGFAIRSVEEWENRKTFDEWAAVVEDARPIEPLREIMRAFAMGGVRAGVDWTVDGATLEFTHHWRFVQASAV